MLENVVYLHIWQEPNMWLHSQGVGENYFNSRVYIYSSDLAYTIAFHAAKINSKIICTDFPVPVINRNSNRK